jgi:hypothetical protein
MAAAGGSPGAILVAWVAVVAIRRGRGPGIMIAVLQALLILGLNLVPAGGVALRGWSPATALTLYWCENLIGSVLVALRIAIHRRLTRNRGHYQIQINGREHAPGGGTRADLSCRNSRR